MISYRNTPLTYGMVAKCFHWLIAVLVIGMLTLGYFLDDLPKTLQSTFYNLHKLTGLTILGLMILRLGWALSNVKPILPADTTAWERLVERVVHFTLYALLLLMPLAGWMGASAAGKPPVIAGIKLAFPFHETSKAFTDMMFVIHGNVALALIALISLHILAALYHHFIRKDTILKRMWF